MTTKVKWHNQRQVKQYLKSKKSQQNVNKNNFWQNLKQFKIPMNNYSHNTNLVNTKRNHTIIPLQNTKVPLSMYMGNNQCKYLQCIDYNILTPNTNKCVYDRHE